MLQPLGSGGPHQFSQQGFSLLEMLVVLMISGVLSSMALSGLKELSNPLQSGTAQLNAFLKQVRATAISQTVAYRVQAQGSGRVITKFGNGCTSASTIDSALRLDLPAGTSLTTTTFDFCFTSRGLANQNVVLAIRDSSGTKSVEVLLGGGVRTL
ncbi:MAG: prepilin-type N-terminal cleavage/methylation domain-containing protein [Proteobacteria bacterium]|nr:prepilin-type N-terminal cleavage/methylation domain-containing protein [Pseudomonadota bacterium]